MRWDDRRTVFLQSAAETAIRGDQLCISPLGIGPGIPDFHRDHDLTLHASQYFRRIIGTTSQLFLHHTAITLWASHIYTSFPCSYHVLRLIESRQRAAGSRHASALPLPRDPRPLHS